MMYMTSNNTVSDEEFAETWKRNKETIANLNKPKLRPEKIDISLEERKKISVDFCDAKKGDYIRGREHLGKYLGSS